MQATDVSDEQYGILPVERPHPRSWKAVASMVLLVLLSGIALNFAVKHLFRAYPALDNHTYASFYEQWKRLLDLDEPVETLILGDSSCRHGVDPRVLDDALGTRSLNVCTIGNAAVINSAWQLATYVERHGAPKRVILVQVHDVWRRGIQRPLIGRVPLRWGFWERLPPGLSLRGDQLKEVFANAYVPVYSQDKTLRDLLMHPSRAGKRRVLFTPQGYSPIEKPHARAVARDRAEHRTHSFPRGWRLSGQNQRALKSMMAMADEHEFDLYVASSPLSDNLLEGRDAARYFEEERSVLDDLTAQSERTHLILHPAVLYRSEEMRTSDHVTAKLATDFTRRVAEAVASVERGR